MWNKPQTLYTNNTTREISSTGKTFTGAHLTEDIVKVLRQHPTAVVFTSHPEDHHPDHAALASFVERAWQTTPSSVSAGRLYEAIVHDPGGEDDLSWPHPPCTWTPVPGKVHESRERRYTPAELLKPPPTVSATPLVFCNDDPVWSSDSGQTPLLLRAINEYKSQVGLIRKGGHSPQAGYEEWVDWTGYLLAFVKRNHLFWEVFRPGAGDFRGDIRH